MNTLRPYLNGMTEFDNNPCTILLVSTDEISAAPTTETENFFTSFSKKVNVVFSENIKETNAIIKERKLVDLKLDRKNTYWSYFQNISLLSFKEDASDIFKISQNFGGDFNVYFFGGTPQIYQFSGVFLDSKEYPYYQEFCEAYDKYLRGTKCIEHKMRLYLGYDNMIVEGYIVNSSISGEYRVMSKKEFSFSLILKKKMWLRGNYDVTLKDSRYIFKESDKLNVMKNEHRLNNNDWR